MKDTESLLKNGVVVFCKADGSGNINCQSEKRCKTYKKISIGLLHVPKVEIERVCPIEKPIDILTKW